MNWVKIKRVPLYPNISDHTTSGKLSTSSTKWQKIRNRTHIKSNNICRCCGGKYIKYLHCIHIDGNRNNNETSNLDTCCRGCYRITHINFDYNDEIELYWSKMSQLDIMRNTIDYIIKNKKIPHPHQIDKNVKSLKLSLVEFSSILWNCPYTSLPKEFQNYKIFFTQNILPWAEPIITEYTPMFDDDDENDKNDIPQIEIHIMSTKEKSFLANHFNSSKKNINEQIINTIKLIESDKLHKRIRQATKNIKYDIFCKSIMNKIK